MRSIGRKVGSRWKSWCPACPAPWHSPAEAASLPRAQVAQPRAAALWGHVWLGRLWQPGEEPTGERRAGLASTSQGCGEPELGTTIPLLSVAGAVSWGFAAQRGVVRTMLTAPARSPPPRRCEEGPASGKIHAHACTTCIPAVPQAHRRAHARAHGADRAPAPEPPRCPRLQPVGLGAGGTFMFTIPCHQHTPDPLEKRCLCSQAVHTRMLLHINMPCVRYLYHLPPILAY